MEGLVRLDKHWRKPDVCLFFIRVVGQVREKMTILIQNMSWYQILRPGASQRLRKTGVFQYIFHGAVWQHFPDGLLNDSMGILKKLSCHIQPPFHDLFIRSAGSILSQRPYHDYKISCAVALRLYRQSFSSSLVFSIQIQLPAFQIIVETFHKFSIRIGRQGIYI